MLEDFCGDDWTDGGDHVLAMFSYYYDDELSCSCVRY